MSRTLVPIRRHPAAWAVLAESLAARRPVRAVYHGKSRLLCPHVLGWRNGRAKVLSYQAGRNPEGSGWRSMFVDELDDLTLTEQAWETDENYAGAPNGIDIVELAIDCSGVLK